MPCERSALASVQALDACALQAESRRQRQPGAQVENVGRLLAIDQDYLEIVGVAFTKADELVARVMRQ